MHSLVTMLFRLSSIYRVKTTRLVKFKNFLIDLFEAAQVRMNTTTWYQMLVQVIFFKFITISFNEWLVLYMSSIQATFPLLL